MRTYFLLFPILIIVLTNCAHKFSDKANEYSVVASALYSKICVENYFTPKKRYSYLDEKYVRYTDSAQEKFREKYQVEGGAVWKVFLGVTFDVVIDNNDNCHVMAYDVNPKIIHDSMDMYYGLLSNKDGAGKNFKDFHVFHFSQPFMIRKGVYESSDIYMHEDGKKARAVFTGLTGKSLKYKDKYVARFSLISRD